MNTFGSILLRHTTLVPFLRHFLNIPWIVVNACRRHAADALPTRCLPLPPPPPPPPPPPHRCCRRVAGKLPLPLPPPLLPCCRNASHCGAATNDTTLLLSCCQAAKLAAAAALPPLPPPSHYCRRCAIAAALLSSCLPPLPCCCAAAWSDWEHLGELGRAWKCFGALRRAGELADGKASWGRICPLA